MFSSRVRLQLGLGVDLASSWLVVMHMYYTGFCSAAGIIKLNDLQETVQL